MPPESYHSNLRSLYGKSLICLSNCVFSFHLSYSNRNYQLIFTARKKIRLEYMDEASFEALFRENLEVLNNIANTIVKDRDVAKDIVQQVFYKLWTRKDELSIQTSMRSYLHRAIINTGLNHVEKHKRMVHVETDDLPESTIMVREEALHQLEASDLDEVLNEAMDQLPSRCRLVFTLSRYDGLTNKEIAEHMETSVKTVENQMGKALKHLRLQLKPFLDNRLISFSTLILINCNYQWVLEALYLS